MSLVVLTAYYVILYFTCANKNMCYPVNVVVPDQAYTTYSACLSDANLWMLPNANPSNAIKRVDCIKK